MHHTGQGVPGEAERGGEPIPAAPDLAHGRDAHLHGHAREQEVEEGAVHDGAHDWRGRRPPTQLHNLQREEGDQHSCGQHTAGRVQDLLHEPGKTGSFAFVRFRTILLMCLSVILT